MHSTEYGRCGNSHCGGQSARIQAIEQEGCDYADMVIAVSGKLCDEVKWLYNCGHKLRMAYNAIHLSQVRPARFATRKTSGKMTEPNANGFPSRVF
mmetsp:Transcript_74709/g.200113  ORF Transcript_74709/g.200113 Transcript_74709/m.200113 type:complete len:96 (+) Transcript_74709:93-380(+)